MWNESKKGTESLAKRTCILDCEEKFIMNQIHFLILNILSKGPAIFIETDFRKNKQEEIKVKTSKE